MRLAENQLLMNVPVVQPKRRTAEVLPDGLSNCFAAPNRAHLKLAAAAELAHRAGLVSASWVAKAQRGECGARDARSLAALELGLERDDHRQLVWTLRQRVLDLMLSQL